jgi:hypothetical protein
MAKRRRELVWEVGWDSGSIGSGAGVERVYRVNGRYVYESLDCGPFDPEDDLKELLAEHGLTDVNEATHTFSSPLFTAEEIAGMLVPYVEAGWVVEINGKPWEFRGDGKGWSPVPQDG